MSSNHTVQQGECLSSIAADYGLSWEKIWNFGGNSALKDQRKDPNVLFPGDVLIIPDVELKTESCATDKRHEFKTTRKPTHVKIRLTIDDKPRGSLSYELRAGELVITGKTDAGGYLEAEIPPDVQSGLLLLGDNEPREQYDLAFGDLDPIDTDEGLAKRLHDLGFHTEGGDLPGAIALFQMHHKMTVTGKADDAVRSKLQEAFEQ
jgi:N-acetylmuramoyl-L-alanine amidase